MQEVLSEAPLKDLNTTQLSALLSQLPGLSTLQAKALQEVLTKTIEGLSGKGGTLDQLALGSLEPNQVLGELLKQSSEPEKLLEQVLAAMSTDKLDALLGTTLAGEPFTKTTVEGLAGNLGTTSKGLAESLNTTTTQLPASAMAQASRPERFTLRSTLTRAGAASLKRRRHQLKVKLWASFQSLDWSRSQATTTVAFV